MLMNFNSDNTKFIIESYYKKYESLEGVLNISTSIKKIGLLGRSIVPTEVTIVKFSLKGKISIQCVEKEVDVPVSMDDIEKAFKFMLDDEGYCVEKVKVNTSTNYSQVSFDGVSVTVKSKKNNKEGVK